MPLPTAILHRLAPALTAALLAGCLDTADPRADPPDAAPDAGPCPGDAGRPDAPAARLAPGPHPPRRVCPGAAAWIAIDVPADARARLTLTADAPLRARLWTPTDPPRLLDDARGAALTLTADAPGPALAEFAGDATATLTVEALPSTDPCPAAPGHLIADAATERPLCPTDTLTIEAPPGAAVTARLTATAPTTVTLRWPADPPIELDRLDLAPDAPAELRWIAPDAPITLHAAAAAPATWQITARADDRATAPITLTGRVTGWRRAVTDDGLDPPAPFATDGARVDLIDPAGRPVAAAHLGPDGTLELTGHAPPAEPLTVRLAAQTRAARAPIRVGPDAALPWAEPIAEIIGDAAIDATLDPDGPTAAAWHIAATAAAGLTRLEPLLPEVTDPPPIVYRWRPGFSAPCGSCFRPGPAPLIDLGGRISDPDEWDAAVILHELGHHIAAVYSRDDSGGGPHDGARIDPAIAWSEGFATFHASWHLDDPIQRDYKITGVALLDLEALDDPRATGTDDATLTGRVSERLVAAVLWDLADAGPTDDDPIALTAPQVFDPLFTGIPTAPDDRGGPGVDLADYLAALGCAPDPDALDALLAARAYPDTAPDRCRAKARAPLAITRHGDTLTLTARVTGRLILRDHTTTTHPITAGQTLRWRPQATTPYISAELHHPAGRAIVPIEWHPAPRAPAPLIRRAGAWERLTPSPETGSTPPPPSPAPATDPPATPAPDTPAASSPGSTR